MAKKLTKQPSKTTDTPRRSAVLSGESYDPGAGSVSRSNLPTTPKNTPFLLGYHPTRWGILDGRCVPQLCKLPLRRGLNGGRQIADGKYNHAAVAAQHADRGIHVLPLSLGYVRRTRVVGGWYYHTPFEAPIRGRKDPISKISDYVDWIESLIDEGHIPAPEAWQLEPLRERYTDLVARLSLSVGSNDNPDAKSALQGRLDDAKAALASIEARIDACEDLPSEAEESPSEAVDL